MSEEYLKYAQATVWIVWYLAILYAWVSACDLYHKLHTKKYFVYASLMTGIYYTFILLYSR